MFIQANAHVIAAPETAADELKKELLELTEFSLRRTNRFILLSLLGVHRCLKGSAYGEKTAVYLSSDNGNLGDTRNVMSAIYKDNKFPKPFNFINTMSNTAAFYIAQSLGVTSANVMVSASVFSFERALEMCRAEMASGFIAEAVVGGVDESAPDEALFTEKYRCAPPGRPVDGSGWLYLSGSGDGAKGCIKDVRSFPDEKSCRDWFASFNDAGPVAVSFGVLFDKTEKDAWLTARPGSEEFAFYQKYGYYDTAASGIISAFMDDAAGTHLIHLNRDSEHRYSAIVIEKF